MNKGLGKSLASAIETGEAAGQKVKEAVGTSSLPALFPSPLLSYPFILGSLLISWISSLMVSFSNWTAGKSKEAKAKTEQATSSAAEKGKKAAADAREKKDEMLEDHLVP